MERYYELLRASTHWRASPPPRAVQVAVVAVAAQVEQPAAVIDDALDSPQVAHSRAGPQGTRPTLRTRATTLTSNASTCGDPG